MTHHTYGLVHEDLPLEIAIFPLEGVLLLPSGVLPLNIFEDRYKAMIEDALASPHRMIGMVQPRPKVSDADNGAEVYAVGCAGKITEFSETPDGRYTVSLHGICRFDIKDEQPLRKGYRPVHCDWSAYAKDCVSKDCLGLDRKRLKTLLGGYFEKENMQCDWQNVDSVSDNKLITCLSMICPFSPTEKQALLEAACCDERAKLFLQMVEMAIYDDVSGSRDN